MLTSGDASWGVRGATLGVWLLAAGSAAFWALQMGTAPHRAAPVAASSRGPGSADPSAIARLLGGLPGAPVAGPAAPALASRFALVGVVAERTGRGAALIAIDGKPARPYRVGAFIEEGMVLQAVHGRQAMLGPKDGPVAVTLDLPQGAPLLSVTRPPFAVMAPTAPAVQPGTPPEGPANLPIPGAAPPAATPEAR
ncbi:type II secretion system protein N [Ramlibacter agri]|uniref:type II secretion system protein N n=1 Tax=Ramlibacter agri TaxID=2728837 RepID=UPI00197D5E12|nr:type II secretion system protein N [Ramlibacter agri]